MKKTFTLLLLGAITLTLLAFAYVSAKAQSGSDGNSALLQQATATPTTPVTGGDNSSNAQTTSSVEVWDQFCVKKIPYTILALSKNASFEVAQSDASTPQPTPVVGTDNSNEIACSSVGTFRDKQVVVCHGPQLFAFTLHISGDGGSEDFQVPLKACPIK